MIRRCISALLSVVLIGTMAFSGALTVSAASAAGTYVGTAPGWAGPITVEVTYADGVIYSVELIEHVDTFGIVDPAFEIVTRRIIENQSLAVDQVTGATVSSFGITLAITNALTEAGADVAALRRAPERPAIVQGATETVDVVIVGSGVAGIMAAFELHFYHPHVSFVLLEQLDIMGGQTPSTGGLKYSPVFDDITSVTHEANDVNFTLDDVFDLFYVATCAPLRTELMTSIYRLGPELVDRWYVDWGVPFDGMTTVAGGPIQAFRPVGSGQGLTVFLNEFVRQNPIDLRLASRATGLLVSDDGVVYGVTVADRYSEYEIHASAVLLATGGFSSSYDLLVEVAPPFAGGTPRVMPGTTGDGLTFTRQFNTPIVGYGVFGGAQGPLRPALQINTIRSNFLITPEGARFADDRGSYPAIDEMYALGLRTVYRVADSNFTIPAPGLDARLAAGVLVAHDTLEDLAAFRGFDVELFLAEVEAYNAAVAAGDSPGFGLPVDLATPMIDGPFFSERLGTAWIGTIPGILIDDYMRVLDGDHNPVPGLYAAGEVLHGNFFTRSYPGSGTAIGLASYGAVFAIRNMLDDFGF